MTLAVCHVTSAHPVDDSRIFYRECLSLVEAGYSVSLLGPEGESLDPGNVDLIQQRLPASRINRILFSPWMLLIPCLKAAGRVYHLHDPELIPLGIILRVCGKKVIYDAHEDLPDQIKQKFWIPKFLRTTVSVFTDAGLKIAGLLLSGFVAATPTIAARLPTKKTVVVRNYPDIKQFPPQSSSQNRPIRILYVGGVSRERGILELVEGFSKLDQPGRIELIIAGEFESDDFAAEFNKYERVDNIKFLGRIPYCEVKTVLASSDIGICVLHPTPNHVNSLPVKLFEYMANGLPVIVSRLPIAAGIVEQAACGIVVDHSDPAQIAQAISKLLESPELCAQMSANGRAAVEEEFNWQTQAEQLVSFYNRFQ